MRATMRKTLKHTAVNFTLRRRFSHTLVLLKGTASEPALCEVERVPQHTLPARGALAPEANLAEARHVR
jgi:hypothetical protein